MKVNRFKLFVENFFVYGLGNMISKIIPLIMLPIITRLMPDIYDFGINDIFNTIVSFCSSIAIMGFYDATFRLFFEKDDQEYKESLCSTALAFTVITSLLIGCLLLPLAPWLAGILFKDKKLVNLIFLSAVSVVIGSTNSIVAAPIRMQNQKKLYIILHTASSLVSYAISIPLLHNGYYLIALPLAGIVATGSIEVLSLVFTRKWFSVKKVNKQYLRELLKIGVPLMPNFLLYWVFNSCDKLMIAGLLGAQFTGMYSIGGKMGQISQMIYMAFASGWQYFAYSTMQDDDQIRLNSKIFEYMSAIAFVAGMVMCCFNDLIFKILFEGDYELGSIVAPYLFMAPLVQMLYQIATTQFVIIKKTWPSTIMLTLGACVNIVLNYFGIRFVGIEGAALATLVGYTFSTILAVAVLKKNGLFVFGKRNVIVTLLFVVYFVLWRFVTSTRLADIVLLCGICFVFYGLYRKEINSIIKVVKQRRKKCK